MSAIVTKIIHISAMIALNKYANIAFFTNIMAINIQKSNNYRNLLTKQLKIIYNK